MSVTRLRGLAAALAVAVAGSAIVACTAPVTVPSDTPSPSLSPAANASPTSTAPSPPTAGVSPRVSASPAPVLSPTADEVYLLSGIRRDATIGCAPVREVLPAGATGAVECVPNNVAVDRFRVTLFTSTDDVLAAYLAEMAANGVAMNSGGCADGQGEGSYFPGPDEFSFPYRQGCFVAGVANYRATEEGETSQRSVHVLISVAGKASNVSAQLEAYAWQGNEDIPGAPTLWRAPT